MLMHGPEMREVMLIVLIFPTKIYAVSTSSGKEFMFALPMMLGDRHTVLFHIVTMKSRVVKGNITLPWHPSSPEPLQFEVRREHGQTVTIDKERLIVNETVQVTWSYRIVANDDISFHVQMLDGSDSMASLKPVPVTGWDKVYFAVSLGGMPALLITAHIYTTDLTVYLPEKFDDAYQNYYILRTSLTRWQTLSIINCETSKDTFSVTGTRIKADHAVGVVSGSCLQQTDSMDCETCKLTGRVSMTTDIVAEMLLPKETFGKTFILLDATYRRAPPYFVVVAGEKDTRLDVSETNATVESFVLRNSGDVKQLNEPRHPRLLVANKGVQVVMVLRSACSHQEHTDVGDPSICIIVPVSLFYDTYTWMTPMEETGGQGYLFLVTTLTTRLHISIDDILVWHNETQTSKYDWQPVYGLPDWTVGIGINHAAWHNAYTKDAQTFGCYLAYVSTNAGYMHPAGFMSSPINTKCIKNENMVPGDLIDNDCDKRIDEETANKLDDDGDSRIDEDIKKPPRRKGDWSPWGRWMCPFICGNGTRWKKERKCDNPAPLNEGEDCEGHDFEIREGSCTTGIKCPEDCPLKKYALNCSKSCPKCFTDCDKHNGSCELCLDGFTDPINSCKEDCPTGYYGYKCQGSCLKKCGKDCTERVTGSCPDFYTSKLYIALVTGIPLLIALLIVLVSRCKRKQQAEDEGGDLEAKSATTVNTKGSLTATVVSSAATSRATSVETTEPETDIDTGSKTVSVSASVSASVTT